MDACLRRPNTQIYRQANPVELRDAPVNPNRTEIGDIKVTTAYSVLAQEARVNVQMGVDTVALSGRFGNFTVRLIALGRLPALALVVECPIAYEMNSRRGNQRHFACG